MKQKQSDHGARGGKRIMLCALAAVAWVSACDVPTSVPIVQPRFVIPGASLRIGVEELLPPGVVSDADAFSVRLSGSVHTWTLGEICGALCGPLEGQLVPKPGFVARLRAEVPLPEGVVGATIHGGALTIRVANNLNFDVLRPAGGVPGSMTVEVTSGGAIVGRTTYQGAMPPASITDIAIPMEPGAVSGPLRVELRIQSPAGDPVRVETEGSVMVAAVPATAVELASLSIRVQDRPIEAAFTTLDLADIDETTREHIREGALVLRLDNPFEATGQMELTVLPQGGEAIRKALEAVPAGESVQRVRFTEEEMRRLLGRRVNISAAGLVNEANEQGVVVRPGDAMVVRADLDVTISTDAD